MGKNSGIDWTDHTWNPWQGCDKVSPGCLNCYMFRDKKRYGQDPSTLILSKLATFLKPFTWKEPAKVFVCSWSDFFHKDADEFRDAAWDVIRKNPHLTFQILTKRPERIADHLPEDWPLKNVWLGVTAENQEMADRRIPILLSITAAVRFVSVEPMLGPVDLIDYLWPPHGTSMMEMIDTDRYNILDWVIVGCESGSGARQMELDWARDLKNQCRQDDVPFFLKQMVVDGQFIKMPALGGQVYDQMPEVE